MKKLFNKGVIALLITAVITTVAMTGCGESTDTTESAAEDKLQVAVTIVPQATFIEKVAGDLVDVVTIIPPGSSPANYQPTPQEMIDLEDSSVYFAIGVTAEEANVMPNMVAESDVKVVELHSIVAEVYEDRYFGAEDGHDEDDHDEDGHDEHEEDEHDEDEHDEDEHDEDEHDEDEHDDHDHDAGTRDPHIWLSPKRVILMVEAIRDELSLLDPDNADTYGENAAAFIAELQGVDSEIMELFAEEEHLGFIITHPSLGYFADDYGLEMTSLEKDGKTATAAWLQEIIDFAVEEDIHVVFYQAEFDSSQSDTLADAIDGQAIELAPLSPDYINNLKIMAEAFLEN